MLGAFAMALAAAGDWAALLAGAVDGDLPHDGSVGDLNEKKKIAAVRLKPDDCERSILFRSASRLIIILRMQYILHTPPRRALVARSTVRSRASIGSMSHHHPGRGCIGAVATRWRPFRRPYSLLRHTQFGRAMRAIAPEPRGGH